MKQKHVFILCLFVFLLGLGLTGYRWLELNFPLLPDETAPTWRIEIQATFEAKGAPVKASLMLPQETTGISILDEHFVSRGYGLSTEKTDGNRRLYLTKRQADGKQTFWYQALIYQNPIQENIATMDYSVNPRSSGLSGIDLIAAQEISRSIERASADNRTFVRLLSSRLKNPRSTTKESLLLSGNKRSRSVSKVLVAVLRVARIPARLVNGLALTPDRRSARLTSWIEFHDEGRWVPFNPTTGLFQKPRDHLSWWHGEEPLLSVVGAVKPKTEIAVSGMLFSAFRVAQKEGETRVDPFSTLSLSGLPIQTQEVYRLLLMVPIGIFLLVILRNVIGLRTFGTFMPVLIALAFRQTDLLYGVFLFSLVLGVGLLIRFYLEHLKLLLVPRLACIVIVVIFLMTLISIVSYKLGWDRGLSVALFPIVILAMTIERMTVVWDERGPKEALIQVSGSFFVALLCFYAMTNDFVEYWTFVFPEALLMILALTLGLGRYTGYRLVELPRFKVLSGSD